MPAPFRQSLRALFVVVGVAAALVGTIRYVLADRNLERYAEMDIRLQRVRYMNATLERDNLRLAREIDACQHDPRYLPRMARQELHLVENGEVVYLFPDGPDSAAPTRDDLLDLPFRPNAEPWYQ